jgi:hypothetical protein
MDTNELRKRVLNARVKCGSARTFAVMQAFIKTQSLSGKFEGVLEQEVLTL